MGERANLGFDTELEKFDPAEWTPSAAPRPEVAPEDRAARRELAEATGFRSREPGSASPGQGAKPPRRRRTGRNAQFNIKTRPETIEAFCAVADAQGWGLGETLEHAVTLLQERYGPGEEEAGR